MYGTASPKSCQELGNWDSVGRGSASGETHTGASEGTCEEKLPEEFPGNDRESENLIPSPGNEEKRIIEQERRNDQSKESQSQAGLRIQRNHVGWGQYSSRS